MSGYTAMTEKLDPEEVKEVMGKVFGEISKVVFRYDGFIEKFIGDAVMALFGAAKSHEDDPVRAIKAAREIHEIVSSISLQYEKKIGKPLSMHTGICTGLVVTGEVNIEKGTHGVLGDTINVASRLSGLAKPGEIVIGPDTYHQAEGYFTSEPMEPTTVKGKAEPIKTYRVIYPKDDPAKTHRLSGMRAELIGRKVEMAQLQEAVTNLKQGKGSIFSIVGDAGTGKSRLIEDFRAGIDLNTIQWREGHCYAYAQNSPYFPLIDLLNRAYQVQEGDPLEQVRRKIERGTRNLIGDRQDLIPYVGSLYSLSYPEIEGVSPEFWKTRLHEAIQTILSALTQRGPTVVCLEDLHWGDLSSIELLRNILSEFRYPALFLCPYRPPFSLFTSHQASSIKSYHEIRLYDLSTSEAQDMVESILKAKDIPPELRKFIQDRVEGNPLYLEEAINALIESETLVREDGSWKLTRSLLEANIPSTVQGIISARLDRLERETKRVLQEASVIGRAFPYEILNRISELKEHIERSLTGLERLDLIRVRSLQPDLEYIFKHALTQAVVYNGLLKKERQIIHERIGLVIEDLFADRLPEFYETLAFHFKQGSSVLKAVDYLMKAGEKSLNRYALEESDQYFREAFDILKNKPDRSKEDDKLLIDLFVKWFMVYCYHGDYKGFTDLLLPHKDLAESIDDKARLAMFYARLGFAIFWSGKLKDAYNYLCRALALGEEANDWQAIAYAAAWLIVTCSHLGFFDEGIRYVEKAQEASKRVPSDPYPYYISLAGLAHIYFLKGDNCRKTTEIGKTLLDFGRKHSLVRCITVGHIVSSYIYSTSGDFGSAINSAQNAIQVSLDRMYTNWAKTMLGAYYVSNDQLTEAKEVISEVIIYCDDFGNKIFKEVMQAFLGAILIVEGDMNRGFDMIQKVRQSGLDTGFKYVVAAAEYILGKVFLQIIEKKKPVSLSTVIKNLGFIITNVPFAYKKGEEHFNKAMELSKEIGTKGVLAQASLDMGLLHKAKGKTDEARKYITDAIQLFEECEADVFLKQAKEALAALG
jgi:class 3 adenylate cyclase/tetratricopeptide (TPR) repeat protein